MVHSRFIYNFPNLETVQVSIDRRMDKQTMAYLYNDILLKNKEQTTDTYTATWTSTEEQYLLSEKARQDNSIHS